MLASSIPLTLQPGLRLKCTCSSFRAKCCGPIKTFLRSDLLRYPRDVRRIPLVFILVGVLTLTADMLRDLNLLGVHRIVASVNHIYIHYPSISGAGLGNIREIFSTNGDNTILLLGRWDRNLGRRRRRPRINRLRPC